MILCADRIGAGEHHGRGLFAGPSRSGAGGGGRGLRVYSAAPLFRVSVSYIYKALGRRRASGDVTAHKSGGGPKPKLAAYDKAHLEGLPEMTPVEIWFQDEARIGQKNGQVRQSARRGTRPRQPTDQRYDNAYLFGAICPARGVGAALALPHADADMMQLRLDEIPRGAPSLENVTPAFLHAIVSDLSDGHDSKVDEVLLFELFPNLSNEFADWRKRYKMGAGFDASQCILRASMRGWSYGIKKATYVSFPKGFQD
jgi:hypothetical protein